MDWNTYFNYLCADGKNEKDRMIKNAKYDLINNIKSTLSCKNICIDGIEYNALIMSMNTNSGTTNEKKIVMMPDVCIHLGEYVCWNNEKWMITDINDDREISYSGKIEKCNNILKFQNQNGDIISYPIVKKENMGSDIKSSNYVDVISGTSEFYVPFNKETSTIELNKRFMTWNQGAVPEIYKVIKITPILETIDPITTGYLIFTMERDVFNPNTDNVDLMISDYFDSNNSIGESLILTCNKDEIIIGGNEVVITSNIENCNWEISVIDEYYSLFHTKSEGYNFYIWCDEDYNLLGQSVIVKCSHESNQSELMLKVVSRI